MKEQIEKLNQIAHTIAQAMYAKSKPEENADGDNQTPGDDAGDGAADESGEKEGKTDDDVVDAEFEDIGKK
jgi:molecular chaperone DnaK